VIARDSPRYFTTTSLILKESKRLMFEAKVWMIPTNPNPAYPISLVAKMLPAMLTAAVILLLLKRKLVFLRTPLSRLSCHQERSKFRISTVFFKCKNRLCRQDFLCPGTFLIVPIYQVIHPLFQPNRWYPSQNFFRFFNISPIRHHVGRVRGIVGDICFFSN
jgi:hypothetical protein